jgi:AraC-like DNA-binding protein
MSRTRHRFDQPLAGQVRTLAWDYPSGWQIAEHAHDSHQLVYATTGAMTIHARRTSWLVPTGWAVWVPATTIHAIDIAGDVSMRTLYLARGLAPRLPTTCRVVAVPPLLRELVLHAVGKGTLDRRRAADGHLIDVLVDLVRAARAEPTELPLPRDPRVASIAKRLRDHPDERRTLAELAVGASARTIQRLFERETGMSFARWRQQARLLEGLRRIAAGAKVTAAASEVGYESPSAFIATFRRQFGVTPARFAGTDARASR